MVLIKANNKLKMILGKLNVSQITVCRSLKLHRNTVYDWCRNRRQPNHYNVERLIRLLFPKCIDWRRKAKNLFHINF